MIEITIRDIKDQWTKKKSLHFHILIEFTNVIILPYNVLKIHFIITFYIIQLNYNLAFNY